MWEANLKRATGSGWNAMMKVETRIRTFWRQLPTTPKSRKQCNIPSWIMSSNSYHHDNMSSRRSQSTGWGIIFSEGGWCAVRPPSPDDPTNPLESAGYAEQVTVVKPMNKRCLRKKKNGRGVGTWNIWVRGVPRLTISAFPPGFREL